MNDCNSAFNRISDFFNVLNPELAAAIKQLAVKKHKYNQSMIPYADFKVDEAPIFRKDTRVDTLSFEDILREAENNGKPITPVKYRSDNSFEGHCPFCGAYHEYIYDNKVDYLNNQYIVFDNYCNFYI